MSRFGSVGRLLIIGVVVLLAVAFLVNRVRAPGTGGLPRDMVVFTAQKGSISVEVSGAAPLTPFQRRQVTATVSGKVDQVVLPAGEGVRDGDTVLRLVSDDLSDSLEAARLDLDLAQKELSRLLEPQAEEPEDLDLKGARLGIEEVRNHLSDLESLKADLSVKSPFSGEVDLAVKEGEEVSEGQLLARFHSSDRMRIEVEVSEENLKYVSEGGRAYLYLTTSRESTEGTIVEIRREGRVHQTSPTTFGPSYYPMKIRIDPGLETSPGMRASVYVYDPEEISMIPLGTGVVAYDQVEEIRAPARGKVESLAVQTGMRVGSGWPILEIRSPDLESRLERARYDLERAQADLHDLLHPQAREYPEIEIQRAQNRVRAAEITYNSRLRSLEGLQVDSPITGQVVEVMVEEGQMISPGTVLFSVADYRQMKLVMPVDELEITGLASGQKALITVDALPGRELSGQVTSISREGRVEGEITTFDVEIVLPGSPELRAGMRATATIVTAHQPEALVVPSEAVTLLEEGLGRVQLLKEGQLHEREVRLGLVSPRSVEILEGLTEGDQVVLTGTVPSVRDQMGPPGR